MKKLFLLFLLLLPCLLFPLSVFAELQEEEVSYKADGIEMKGYLVYDDKFKGERPGVLVVHEWWGLNDYSRSRAAQLAKLGYTAFAVDMYGDGKTATHPEDAGKFSKAVMARTEGAKARFQAGLNLLKTHATTKKEKISAVGYCFGGAVVLNMARLGEPLNGVASFHGSLASNIKAKPGSVKTKFIVFNGADDPFVPKEEVEGFETEMKELGVDYEVFNYEGAKHSFTSPAADKFGKEFNLPLAYDKKADEASWGELKRFLSELNN